MNHMLSKTEHAGHTEHHQKSTAGKAPPPRPAAPMPNRGISAARAAVQQFLSSELGAREVRITKIAPLEHGEAGWSAEAEILVPNLEVKGLGLPLTQEVLECEYYVVELDTDMTIKSYGPPGSDGD